MVTKVADLRPNPNPVDPNVKIPAAVQRAAAAAAAAQAAAYPENQPPVEPSPPAAPDGIVIAPPAPPAPAPAHTPAPVTPPGNEPPAPAPADQSWEHRFRSSEGRRTKLEQLLSQANDRITSLESIIQDLQDARASAPAPAQQPTTLATPARLVTQQEESEFGPEMLDVMGRRAKEIVSPELEEMRLMLKGLEQKLTGTTTEIKRSARQDMLTTLDASMPEWRQVNNLPEFKTWLALPDPYFGVTRHSALLSAFEKNDTSRVLNFFKGFVSELAVTAPDETLPVVVEPAAPQPAKTALESLAAPGRARTPAQTHAPAEKQIITTADINAFYAAKARGAYNGREAEFAALEHELFKAQREGRVRAV